MYPKLRLLIFIQVKLLLTVVKVTAESLHGALSAFYVLRGILLRAQRAGPSNEPIKRNYDGIEVYKSFCGRKYNVVALNCAICATSAFPRSIIYNWNVDNLSKKHQDFVNSSRGLAEFSAS